MKKQDTFCERRRTSIGGQALMEGIMMRGPQKSAMAVRRPNGEIFFEEIETEKKRRPAVCRLPIVRGVFGFFDSITIGYKALMRSAEIAMEDAAGEPAEPIKADSDTSADTVSDEEKAEPVKEESETSAETVPAEETTEGNEEKTVPAETPGKEEPKSAIGKAGMTSIMLIATVLGFALAIGLFVWLPTQLYALISEVAPRSWHLARNRVLRSVFEGVIKIVILVLYMVLVSLMKDIRRTFMYHGAEHKTIFCYENGMPLTVENVKKQRRFHPRCGTSFLILMLLVSIVIGLFVPAQFGSLKGVANTLLRAAIKLLLIPLVMGIGYELLKFAGRHDNLVTRVISAPGMWLQRITVREPEDDMIECAVRAFIAVLPDGDRQAEEAAIAAAPEETAETKETEETEETEETAETE